MKFPVIFRILAVLNILFSIFLLLVSVVLFSEAGRMELFAVFTATLYAGIAIWLIISAFVWFFAFRGAYFFLYTCSIAVFIIAGHLSYSTFGLKTLVSLNSLSQGEKIQMLLPVIMIALFGLFIFLTLFFKPVINWTAQTSDPKKEKFDLRFFIAYLFVIFSGPLSIFGIHFQKYYEVQVYPSTVWIMKSDYSTGKLLVDENKESQWNVLPLANEKPYITFLFNEENEITKIKILSSNTWIKEAILEFDSVGKTNLSFERSGDTSIANLNGFRFKEFKLTFLSFELFDPKHDATPGIQEITFSALYPYFKKQDYYYADRVNNSIENKNEANVEEMQHEETVQNLNNEKLEKLFTPGIKRIWDWQWFFDEESNIPITDKSLGMFMGGSASLKYYFFPQCFSDDYSFIDYDHFERPAYEYSGIDPFVKKAKNDSEFSYVNPEFIKWASENLLPEEDQLMYGYDCTELYNKIGQRYCRLLTETHEYISYDRLQNAQSNYIDSMATPDFRALRYLNNEYGNLFPEYKVTREYQLTADMAIGFWIRRHIDGSETELWKALVKIMRRYDEDWFLTKTAQHKNKK
jgi:hypothetical protein